jgi:hypothetical protein
MLLVRHPLLFVGQVKPTDSTLILKRLSVVIKFAFLAQNEKEKEKEKCKLSRKTK